MLATIEPTAINDLFDPNSAEASVLKKALASQTALLFHVSKWSQAKSVLALTGSDWYIYSFDAKTGSLKLYSPGPSGDPPVLYGKSFTAVIGIQTIRTDDITNVNISYTVATTAKTPQNLADLAAVLQALGGLAAPRTNGAQAHSTGTITTTYCKEIAAVKKTSAPYDMAVTFTLSPNASAQDKTKVTDCTNPTIGCVISRTFSTLDREFADLSLGMSVPGVVEAKFGDNNGTVTRSVTRHTDAYVFGSFYPAFWWKPNNSFWPHIDIGIPVTGTPLHRPFGGLSEQIPGSQKLLNVPVYFYGGVARLIESAPATFGPGSKPADANTFMQDVHNDVKWKGMWGFEFPVTTLIGKITKK